MRSLLFTAMMSVTAASQAQIAVSDAILDFAPGQSNRQDITVVNNGEERAFVKVTPARIFNPGTPEQKREEIENPMELGLIASPNRLVLQPGQKKVIRVSTFGNNEEERLYRLNVTPAAVNTPGEATSEKKFDVKILIAYDVLVINRPANLIGTYTSSHNGNKLTLKNTGNTNLLFTNGKSCTSDDKCTDLKPARIHPGLEWTTEAPANTTITYSVADGLKTTKVTM